MPSCFWTLLCSNPTKLFKLWFFPFQVWFQNRRSKLRRRVTNRPAPLDISKSILSTRSRNTPGYTTATPATLPLPTNLGYNLGFVHGYMPQLCFPITMQPSPSVNSSAAAQTTQTDTVQPVRDPVESAPHHFEPRHMESTPIMAESKPKQPFNRPWETPSPSKTTSISDPKMYDPVLTTAAVDYSKPLATPGSIMVRPFSPSLGMGHLPAMSPFVPYSALGYPSRGFMFFGVWKHCKWFLNHVLWYLYHNYCMLFLKNIYEANNFRDVCIW